MNKDAIVIFNGIEKTISFAGSVEDFRAKCDEAFQLKGAKIEKFKFIDEENITSVVMDDEDLEDKLETDDLKCVLMLKAANASAVPPKKKDAGSAGNDSMSKSKSKKGKEDRFAPLQKRIEVLQKKHKKREEKLDLILAYLQGEVQSLSKEDLENEEEDSDPGEQKKQPRKAKPSSTNASKVNSKFQDLPDEEDEKPNPKAKLSSSKEEQPKKKIEDSDDEEEEEENKKPQPQPKPKAPKAEPKEKASDSDEEDEKDQSKKPIQKEYKVEWKTQERVLNGSGINNYPFFFKAINTGDVPWPNPFNVVSLPKSTIHFESVSINATIDQGKDFTKRIFYNHEALKEGTYSSYIQLMDAKTKTNFGEPMKIEVTVPPGLSQQAKQGVIQQVKDSYPELQYDVIVNVCEKNKYDVDAVFEDLSRTKTLGSLQK